MVTITWLPKTGWDTSTASIRLTLREYIQKGHDAGGKEGSELWEACKLFGQVSIPLRTLPLTATKSISLYANSVTAESSVMWATMVDLPDRGLDLRTLTLLS